MELKYRTYSGQRSSSLVLIEPIGIEILNLQSVLFVLSVVLIEPIGIEMDLKIDYKNLKFGFNRTYWNWNKNLFKKIHDLYAGFNRTYWNWNFTAPTFKVNFALVLIEPIGIEIQVAVPQVH